MHTDSITALSGLIHELAPWAAVALAAIAAWQSSRARQHISESANKIDTLQESVNGRMDQLVSATSDAARKEGYLKGAASTTSSAPVEEQPNDSVH